MFHSRLNPVSVRLVPSHASVVLLVPQPGGGGGQNHVHLWSDWPRHDLWSAGGGRSPGPGQAGMSLVPMDVDGLELTSMNLGSHFSNGTVTRVTQVT